MRTPFYQVLTVVAFVLFALTWMASYLGWGLRPTASTTAQRNAVRTHSARIGARYLGSGPHFGK